MPTSPPVQLPDDHAETQSQNASKDNKIIDSKSDIIPAPQNLQPIISTNRYVTLSWHEPENQNDQIIGYSVYYRQEGSHRFVNQFFIHFY